VRRPLLALPLLLASALLLAGCTGEPEQPEATPTATPETRADVCATPDGDAASSIEVTGDPGSPLTATFSTPLEVDATERAVLTAGAEVPAGTLVHAAYALYDGTTGEQIESYGWGADESPIDFRADYGLVAGDGFAKTLGCLGAGSRVVGVITPEEGFGETGTQYGIDPDDVLVFVAEVVDDTYWTTDVPEVDGSAENTTVTLPATAPPSDLRIVVLEKGDGDVVAPSSSVSVNYLGTSWETGEVFDNSFERGQPATFSVGGVVQGFSQALIGQTVGSRVLVSMPPALGYGEAGASDHPLAGQTLVFLIDIVAIAG
jgi:peptidylprolyl isomerase